MCIKVAGAPGPLPQVPGAASPADAPRLWRLPPEAVSVPHSSNPAACRGSEVTTEMQKPAIAATVAAFLVSGLVITGQAVAQTWRWVGPPIGERGAKRGHLCWQDKSGGGYFGYWDACARPKAAKRKAPKRLDPRAAQIASKRVLSKVSARKTAKSTKTQTRSSARFGKKTKVVAREKYAVSRKTAASPPAQLNSTVDPVIERARTSVSALMENPASAQFYGLKRAVRRLLNESVDTICGHVKGKDASGRDTGEIPFLYIIRDDRDGEAYLVDGTSYMAKTVHSVVCN
jgi:hypothetical protein